MIQGDLHIHTMASDGWIPSREIAEQAAAVDLDFISITDHNTVSGIEPAEEVLDGSDVLLIPGVELSAQPEADGELHILGYGFDPTAQALLDVCRSITRRKNEQMWRIVRRLRQEGIGINVSGLPAEEDEDYVGRPMLAAMLVEDGVVHSTRQAFTKFLGSEGGAYVPMREFDPRRCIEAIHAAGGLAVLAHPRLHTVDRWIQPLARMGLDGVETYRPRLAGNEQLYIEKAAEHFDLVVTGGSDLHGRGNEAPLGSFRVSGRQVGTFFDALAARTPSGAPAGWRGADPG
ncbi:MAG: PHP domain-containing protein [Candidatus Brocadiia bacterium]